MVSALLIGVSLGVGVLGYRYAAGLSWIDALLNASMILTGMGPVSRLDSTGAKLFASGYALFAGVVFIASIILGGGVSRRAILLPRTRQLTRCGSRRIR